MTTKIFTAESLRELSIRLHENLQKTMRLHQLPDEAVHGVDLLVFMTQCAGDQVNPVDFPFPDFELTIFNFVRETAHTIDFLDEYCLMHESGEPPKPLEPPF